MLLLVRSIRSSIIIEPTISYHCWLVFVVVYGYLGTPFFCFAFWLVCCLCWSLLLGAERTNESQSQLFMVLVWFWALSRVCVLSFCFLCNRCCFFAASHTRSVCAFWVLSCCRESGVSRSRWGGGVSPPVGTWPYVNYLSLCSAAG